MRTSLLMLLWLAAIAPVAHAADWLSWRKVGDASLTWGPFTVYTSQLSTPDGRYHGPEQDQALIITYKRDIDRDQLVEATRDQWQAQGILEREPQSEAWLRMLQSLWPDVTPGSQLTFVVKGKQGQFWYRASGAEKSFTPLGPSQSAAFSTNFLAIWLDPRTQYPELRQQLLGGEK
ncbi:hypothetical protein J8629_20200 [Serratia fonticola]|nr:hypothetical protein [Serratia fonticola]ERK10103.1 putative periplasmic protein [Serratia fonticola AU-AP2C]ALX92138.1 hypothetical protein AV650_00465 [Serratia fonticola]ALX97016.1 hypothetical protein AV650_27305 [Serratia fonticola]MBP0999375.1 hypothetical protein [Serratia fonticola]MBP1004409.1 hypothetical protein [Serratia fonticola]